MSGSHRAAQELDECPADARPKDDCQQRVMGGLLMQDRDGDLQERSTMEVVTKRKPTEDEWGDALFAWKVCKHVRSNSIVIARNLATIGVGAGQMSRVDSVRIAVENARREE